MKIELELEHLRRVAEAAGRCREAQRAYYKARRHGPATTELIEAKAAEAALDRLLNTQPQTRLPLE